MANIVVNDAREHNLKNLTVGFPSNAFTCVTGPSGCGKSSLLYDTIYAESQRNLLESISASMFDQRLMDKPDVGHIDNLHPALDVSQTSYNFNPRSTVGTVTDISHYLRALYAFVYNQEHEERVEASFFSPNNPTSACPVCNGLGEVYVIDETKVIPDPDLSLAEGGIAYYMGTKTSQEYKILQALCDQFGIDISKPVRDLTSDEFELLMYREEPVPVTVRYKSSKGKYRQKTIRARGAVRELERALAEGTPSAIASIRRFLGNATCNRCGGARLNENALALEICGQNIASVSRMSMPRLTGWLESVEDTYRTNRYAQQICQLTDEMRHRASTLEQLNLHYLSLDRSVPSLSGGEMQRVRISNQLNCSLSGLIYILDEPCKGLHYRDVSMILNATRALIDKGNTVLAIEHNPWYLASADRIIEMGPVGGPEGGYIVQEHDGGKTPNLDLVFKDSGSLNEFVTIDGINYHNLRDVTVGFPIGKVTSLTGVSGSGKSTLADVISAACSGTNTQLYSTTRNTGAVSRVRLVSQQPIGKTSRSTVISYLGIYDAVRKLFAATERAKELGLTSADFSMNSGNGRCEYCQGTGKEKVELAYLPESYITCHVCHGRRFKDKVLEVQYRGRNIDDILDTPVSELMDVFDGQSSIQRALSCLSEIGLGYITLGRMSMSLSGGEAQRIKLAKYMYRETHPGTLYVLDEPTIGLSSADIDKLRGILLRIINDGGTVVMVDHNLEFIASTTDYMIDLGCEAGDMRNSDFLAGLPAEVVRNPKSSWYDVISRFSIQEA